MTRSENLRRLWQDPEFRARQRQRLKAHIVALNKSPENRARARAKLDRLRQDEVFVAKQREAARKWMTAWRRGFEDHPDADSVGAKVSIKV